MRSSVSTPGLRNRFDRINRKKSYAKQVKPFNFLVSVSVDSIEWPREAFELGGFHPIAPYSSNPSEWLRFYWTDLHSGREYRIKSAGYSNRFAVRVQTCRDVLDRFRIHPEAKSAGSDGKPSHSRTKGLLGRLHVRTFTVSHIGKESNLLEAQEEGVLLTDPQTVYFGEKEWKAFRSLLNRVSISELADRSEIPARTLRSYRRGDRRPSAKTLQKIKVSLVEMLDEAEG